MSRKKKGFRRSIGRVRKYTRKKEDVSETYESDTFFRNILDETSLPFSDTTTDNSFIEDPLSADDHFVVLDKVYQHDPDDDLDAISRSKYKLKYTELKQKCIDLGEQSGSQSFTASKYIRFVQLYEDSGCANPVVKVCITVFEDFTVNVMVHGVSIPSDHDVRTRIPEHCKSLSQVKTTIELLSGFSVCPGNPDREYQHLLPVGSYLDVARECQRAGYRDSFCVPTLRSTKCQFFINKHNRCSNCRLYRKTLNTQSRRQKETATPKKNWVTSKKCNEKLTNSEKIEKLKQLRRHSSNLQSEVNRLKKQLNKSIKKNGVRLTDADSMVFRKLMNESDSVVKETYPIETSIQRLFWEQQMRYSQLSNKKGMRWHPMIIKWCIFLKGKSSTTYDSLRKSGFVSLPSERTLFDYSNVLTRGTGFNDDVIVRLQEEVSHFKDHERIVGLLQDEVRIRSDLVYDKHSGQLIGFIDLDSAGNDLLNMQEAIKNEKKALARYILAVMVRGLSTKLKFPMAHFATNGVVSDQLFSILWEAVEILEIDVELTVLFITSDGASPNRRFIRLHSHDNNSVVYRAENVFAEEQRYIYFISDPPHLIKTTRNNFSNSYSHKNTKKLWKNDKDISWLHVVDLYKERCNGLYRMCPKISQSHIDLTAFSSMKVNLAAQVLSSSVANALEFVYGYKTAETVTFIRHMDRFFYIMNTRNFIESAKKRNANLKPFTDVDDPRLTYLKDDFLNYFEEWQREVDEGNGNFTRSERNSMILSYQTIEGLKITVNSVTECIKYCLNNGMPFVLTEKFNQDAIEQHFGVHRASGGANTNPSLHDFNSTMQKLRTVGGQALAPLRGNTKRRLDLEVDNTPLSRKQKHH